MIQRVKADINLKALQNNFQIAKSRSGLSKVAAVIKANAYGHGLIPVARALSSYADLFAVTDTNEALLLHEAQLLHSAEIYKPILILQGIINREDILSICQHNFQLVVHSLEQLTLIDEEVSKCTLKSPLTLWLKLDSGMSRLGITAKEYHSAYSSLKNKPYVKDIIMMTHLANSSLPNSALNDQQLECFHKTKLLLESSHSIKSSTRKPHIRTSIPASSGIMSNIKTLSDWARPGLMLYGSSPFDYANKALQRDELGLQAVMTLRAQIISIQQVTAGSNIGYCSQFISPHDMTVAIISIGYADGYPSTTPNGTPVLINGLRCLTVGRVSMDMLAVDISACPSAKIGDLATLWGDDLSLDEIADKTGILSYNLTCSISSRVSINYG